MHDGHPRDPMISICMTVASLGRAMQRQCDNRHHLVTQAIAFITRYRAFRALQGDNVVEIEYNVGRTFHQLGFAIYLRRELFGHAARHYESALAAAAIQPADTACTAEAAYNLSMIYVGTVVVLMKEAEVAVSCANITLSEVALAALTAKEQVVWPKAQSFEVVVEQGSGHDMNLDFLADNPFSTFVALVERFSGLGN
ncbi:hypothetical protein DFH06DRAFT_1332586 [Mycena polygramma]|nr:hypothetical protein DFH06DRAFT_1332586 [Mycena polygramma]